MITIPEIVEEIVLKTPFFEEGLSQEILNLSALARKMKPEIEKKLFKSIEVGAIIMALKRLTTKLKSGSKVKNVFKKAPELIVRSNLMELTLQNSDFIQENKIQGDKRNR